MPDDFPALAMSWYVNDVCKIILYHFLHVVVTYKA